MTSSYESTNNHSEGYFRFANTSYRIISECLDDALVVAQESNPGAINCIAGVFDSYITHFGTPLAEALSNGENVTENIEYTALVAYSACTAMDTLASSHA